MRTSEAKQRLDEVRAERARLNELEDALLTIIRLSERGRSGTHFSPGAESVREAFIKRPGQEITATALYAATMADGSCALTAQSSFSATVSRLAKEGFIRVVEPGSGRKPATYVYEAPASNPNN